MDYFNIDENGQISDLTYVLCHADKSRIDTLNVVDFNFKFAENQNSEISFTIYKNLNECYEEVIDFKLIYIPEWDEYFQIGVEEIIDENGVYKNLKGTGLCEAELSQLSLDGIEINTENDIARQNYMITKIYDPEHPTGSLLHRILKDKAPHYHIAYISPTLKDLVRSFSINSTNINDFLRNTLSEELDCVVEYKSSDRGIYLFDTLKYCSACGYRSDFATDTCPKCGEQVSQSDYGHKSGIVISPYNLAESINVSTDKDSVKNCFKVVGGDDMINAALAAINPNGTPYIYNFSKEMLDDMPTELKGKIENYNETYAALQPEFRKASLRLFDLYDELAYYQTTMMPQPLPEPTTAYEQLQKLVPSNIGEIGIANLKSDTSKSIIDNAVLSMARIFMSRSYKVEINSSNYVNNKWTGRFHVYALGKTDEDKDEATNTSDIVLTITSNYETFVKNKIDKTLANEDSYDLNENWTLYSLDMLNVYQSAYQSVLEVLMQMGTSTETANGRICKDLYDKYYVKITQIQDEIITRQSTIDGINNEINLLLLFHDSVSKQLNIENFFGDLYETFCVYRRDDEFNNDNFISDGLSNSQLLQKADELLSVAETALYRASQTQYSISGSVINFMLMKDFEYLHNDCKVGNWIYIENGYGDIYKARITEISGNYSSVDKINLTFSNVYNVNQALDAIHNVFIKANQMATSFKFVKKQAEQGKNANITIDAMRSHGLKLANYRIINADNQEFVIDEHGITGKEFDDLTGGYSGEQIKLVNNLLCFTDDGWKTAKTALGKIQYINPETNMEVTKYGLITDTVIAGDLIGNTIIGGNIYSSNYWNSDDGSHIDLDNGHFSFAGGKLSYDGSTLSISANAKFDNGAGIKNSIDAANSNANSAWSNIEQFKDACANGTTVISGGCITTGLIEAQYINTEYFQVCASDGVSGWRILSHPEDDSANYICGNNGAGNNVVIKTGGGSSGVAFACGLPEDYNPGDPTAGSAIQLYHDGKIFCKTIRFIDDEGKHDLSYADIMTGTPDLSTHMITGSFFTDDYGNLVVFKNSEDNSNDVPTKTWVENYVKQHGGDVTNNLVVKTSTNANNLSINNTEKEIASFNVLSTDNTKAIINLTVPYISDIDGSVIVLFYIDGVLDGESVFKEHCNKGYNLFTLTNFYEIQKNNRLTISIRIKTEPYISDVEKNSAKIESLLNYIKTNEYIEPVLEENNPTININKQSVKAVLFAQGIAGEGQWDGTLNFAEELKTVSIVGEIGIGRIEESVIAECIPVQNMIVSEKFDEIRTGGVYNVGQISETVEVQTFGTKINEIIETLTPISIGERKLMLGGISDSFIIENTEE